MWGGEGREEERWESKARPVEMFGPSLLPRELAPLYSQRRSGGNKWGPFNQIL